MIDVQHNNANNYNNNTIKTITQIKLIECSLDAFVHNNDGFFFLVTTIQSTATTLTSRQQYDNFGTVLMII